MMLKLKLLNVALVIGLFLGAGSSFAEEHSGSGTGTADRILVPSQSSRFLEYVSACMAGRPLPPVQIPSPIGNAPDNFAFNSVSNGDGAGLFQAKCMMCHNGAQGPGPDLTSMNGAKAQEALRRIGLPDSDPLRMPKGAPISAEEKAAISAYLQTKMAQP